MRDNVKPQILFGPDEEGLHPYEVDRFRVPGGWIYVIYTTEPNQTLSTQFVREPNEF